MTPAEASTAAGGEAVDGLSTGGNWTAGAAHPVNPADGGAPPTISAEATIAYG